jgi:hypothetical protein
MTLALNLSHIRVDDRTVEHWRLGGEEHRCTDLGWGNQAPKGAHGSNIRHHVRGNVVPQHFGIGEAWVDADRVNAGACQVLTGRPHHADGGVL